MAGIDRFIEAAKKYDAERLIFDAAQRATIVIGEAARYVTSQPVTEQQIRDLVREILPEDLSRVTTTVHGRTFDYESPSGRVRVEMRRQEHGTRVEVAIAGVETASDPAADAPGAALEDDGADAECAGGTWEVEPAAPNAGAPVSAAAEAPVRKANPATVPPAGATRGATPTPPAEPAAGRTEGFAAARGLLQRGPEKRPKITALFEKMVGQRASDMHLSVGSPPLFRKDGEITALGEKEALDDDAIRQLLLEITPQKNCVEFDERRDTDFSYEMNGNARFRVNLFVDRRGVGAVFRLIPGKIPTPQELGLPKHVLELCTLSKGLVLLTGPTGSGKSTTLAAMIEHINNTRSAHIITIEDPIEFVYTNKRCLVNQREVGIHTDGFKQALRAALREDPDIVLVGEMRDLETVTIALETAETGHLVFGTLHTNTASSAIDRIIDQFPSDRQAQVRTMLADTLRGVIAQTLVKRRGGGLVAAQEILLVNSAVSNLIREGKTFQIPSIMQTGRGQGMITLDDSLLNLVRSGIVDAETALGRAPNRAEFKLALDRVRERQGSSDPKRATATA